MPFAGLGFIFVFFLIVTQGGLVSGTNISNMLAQLFTIAVVSIGATFVYAHGGMDFSIGATTGLAMYFGAMVLSNGLPVWLAILTCIVIGVMFSIIVGGLARVFMVPVFIVSLCIRSLNGGILKMLTEKSRFSDRLSKVCAVQ